MKISTRQYLKDLRKAEKKGKAKGFNKAYNMYTDNEKRNRLIGRIDRLEALVDRLSKEAEAARMIKDGGKEKPAPAAPAGDTEATFF